MTENLFRMHRIQQSCFKMHNLMESFVNLGAVFTLPGILIFYIEDLNEILGKKLVRPQNIIKSKFNFYGKFKNRIIVAKKYVDSDSSSYGDPAIDNYTNPLDAIRNSLKNKIHLRSKRKTTKHKKVFINSEGNNNIESKFSKSQPTYKKKFSSFKNLFNISEINNDSPRNNMKYSDNNVIQKKSIIQIIKENNEPQESNSKYIINFFNGNVYKDFKDLDSNI